MADVKYGRVTMAEMQQHRATPRDRAISKIVARNHPKHAGLIHFVEVYNDGSERKIPYTWKKGVPLPDWALEKTSPPPKKIRLKMPKRVKRTISGR